MSIELDFTSDNPQVHSQYDYPEDDDELMEETRELLRECLDCVEAGDTRDMPFLEASGHVTELRNRDIEVVSSVDCVKL